MNEYIRGIIAKILKQEGREDILELELEAIPFMNLHQRSVVAHVYIPRSLFEIYFDIKDEVIEKTIREGQEKKKYNNDVI